MSLRNYNPMQQSEIIFSLDFTILAMTGREKSNALATDSQIKVIIKEM